MSVSLVITHYNQLEHLRRLLKFSNENFSLGAGEVIIIDDFSLEINELQFLKSEYPKYKFYTTGVNSGPSYARNLGAKLSKCDYIQFLDADDWILPDKIIRQYEEAKKNSMPSFVCSNWARVNYNSDYLKYDILDTYCPNLREPTLINIMSNFFPLMSGLILKQDFLKINGFDETMRLIEDVNLAIRLYDLRQHFILYETEPMFFYRVNNPKSLSNSNKLEFNRSILKNYKICYNIANKYFSKVEVRDFKHLSYHVLWHIYLEACTIWDQELKNDCIVEMNEVGKSLRFYKNHGKTYLLTVFFGYRISALLLRFLNQKF